MYWAGKRERNLCVKFVNLTYHFVVRALHLEEDAEGEDQTADATDDTANTAYIVLRLSLTSCENCCSVVFIYLLFITFSAL